MTLSVRNNILKVGIGLSAIFLCFVLYGGYLAFDAFPGAAASSIQRANGIVPVLSISQAEPSAYVPFWAAVVVSGFSFFSLILIYYFFGKTQSPEIFFIALFVFSLAFEIVRVAVPLRMVYSFPASYLINTAKILFFCRCFGLFALFTASVYAAGMDAQKQQILFIPLVLASLLFAMNVSEDVLVWNSTFVLWNGYKAVISKAEMSIIAVTVLTFFISAYTSGFKNYLFVGIGTLFAFLGRDILINSDNWITPIPGLVFLVFGVWFACSHLRKVYLWL